ncbi:MAG: hypothetical protein P8R45_06030 [Candidatus Binatia bacterium]|nr:hypothetical protein [Candidatus Binatia bacterium]
MLRSMICLGEGIACSEKPTALVLVVVMTFLLAGCPARQKNPYPGPPEVFNPSLLDRG